MKKKLKVLIVEDNEELLQILNTLFAPFYQVILAGNGEEGLRKANEEKAGFDCQRCHDALDEWYGDVHEN